MARGNQNQGLAKVPAVPKRARGNKTVPAATKKAARTENFVKKVTKVQKEYTKTTVIYDPVFRSDPLPPGAEDREFIVYDTSYDSYASSGDENGEPNDRGDADARQTINIIQTYGRNDKRRTKHMGKYLNGLVADKEAQKRVHLSPYDRDVVVHLKQKGVEPKIIAESFGVSEATVSRIHDEYLHFKEDKKKDKRKIRGPILWKLHCWAIRCWLQRDPQLQLEDLREMILHAFGINASITTIYRAVRDMRFSFKLAGISPIARNTERVIKIREIYAKIFVEILDSRPKANIYYIDKSSFTSTLRYNQGWFFIGQKDGVIKKQAVRGQSFSMVALLGPRGVELYQMIQGSHNGESFEAFLKVAINHIEKQIGNGTAVICLDNVSLHKVEAIRNMITWIDPETWDPSKRVPSKSVRLLFLPPYSPFLNPIEEVFGWIKKSIKKHRPNDSCELFGMIHSAVKKLSAEMTLKFYQHANTFLADSLAKKPIQ